MEKNKDKKIKNEESNNNQEKVIKELKIANEELTNLLVERQNQIDQLKMEVKNFNEEFKNQITQKAKQADQVIQIKIQEIEKKAKDEIAHAKKYAIENQALEIINIVNQFELALSYTPANQEVLKYQKGFQMFLTMLNNLLKELNIEIIKPVMGQEFDPNLMECFDIVTNAKLKDQEIVEIMSVGYKLFDHILKPALVKVNKI